MSKRSRFIQHVVQVAVVSVLLGIGPTYSVLAETPAPGSASQTVATATPSVTGTVPAAATARPVAAMQSEPGARPPAPKRGPKGGAPVARAQQEIDRTKTDLAAAQGKMDLSLAQGWLNQASSLLQIAESDQGASKIGKAREEAGAAQELAKGADELMVAKLGSQLPSQANKPAPPAPPSGAPTVSPQARASRDLANTYRDIINQRDMLSSMNLGAPWPDVLKQAEDQYSVAYNAYQSGNYDQASASVRVAGHLAHAIDHAVHASTDPSQPVSVPAPQF